MKKCAGFIVIFSVELQRTSYGLFRSTKDDIHVLYANESNRKKFCKESEFIILEKTLQKKFQSKFTSKGLICSLSELQGYIIPFKMKKYNKNPL